MRFRSIVGLVLAAALVVGCGKKGDKNKDEAKSGTDKGSTAQPAGDNKAPPAQVDPGKLDFDPATATWKAVPIQETGVAVEAVEQAKHKGGEMGEAKYFRQNWGPAQMAVWHGPNRSIEEWRQGFRNRKDVKLSETSTVEMCGGEAKKQEAVIPARVMGGKLRESIPVEDGTVADEASGAARDTHTPSASSAGGGSMGTGRGTPEMVVVVMAFQHKDEKYIASFRVPTAHREAFAEVEKHFFESITCE